MSLIDVLPIEFFVAYITSKCLLRTVPRVSVFQFTQRDSSQGEHTRNAGVDADEDARFATALLHKRGRYNAALTGCDLAVFILALARTSPCSHSGTY